MSNHGSKGTKLIKISLLLLSLLLMASVFTLTSCDLLNDLLGGECTQHIDDDKNGICDVCGQTVKSEDGDGSEGGDNSDGEGDSHIHTDANCNGSCDECNADVDIAHKDENSDSVCDGCGICLSHADGDCNGYCDRCNAEITVKHSDEDGDGICDVCGRCATACIDGDCSGECDVCHTEMTVSHVDSDGDGDCDTCGKCLEHRDTDKDAKCDLCGITLQNARKSVSPGGGRTVYPTTYIEYSGATYRGAYITYTITVKNEGTAESVFEITDTVPYGTEYVSGADTHNGSSLGWQLTLGVGEEDSVSYTVAVTLGKDDTMNKIIGSTASINGYEVGCEDVYVANSLNEVDEGYISYAIRILSTSTYTGFDFAKHAYTIAFTNAKAITANFITDAQGTLSSLFSGDERLTAIAAPSLYGGLLLTAPVNGIAGVPNKTVTRSDLISGDILLVEREGVCFIYIVEGSAIWDITSTAMRADAPALLSSLVSAQRYAVLRPSMTMTLFTPSDPDEVPEEMNEYQKALVSTANSYLLRGESLQYEDVYFGLSSQSGEYRWAHGKKDPEEYTSDEWGYVNCAVFTYDVYMSALGYILPSNMYTTERLTNNAASNGMSVFRFERTRKDVYTPEQQLEIERQFMAALEVGDIMVRRHTNVSTGKTTGHAMLYVGNGRFIHSGGASYTQSGGIGYEVFEPTIRCHKVHDYLFGEAATSMFNDEDNIITVVRPLNTFKGEIPEATRARMSNMENIRAEKLSSHPSSVSVNPGDLITFTFSIFNVGDTPRTVEVYDKVPVGTVYVSGGENVSGDELRWTVTVDGGETAKVSYTVRVDNLDDGTLIDGRDGKVGGVPHRCAATRVKKTLTGNQQNAIKDAIDELRLEGTTLSKLELVNEIYKRALGIDSIFGDTNPDSVMRDGDESIFATSTKTNNKKYLSMLRTDETYYSRMLVDHLYGGMRFDSSLKLHDRTRLLKEHNLVVGDVLIGRTSSSVNVYIYAGDGELLLINSGVGDAADFGTLAQRLLYYGRDFAVVRPSYVIE